MSCKTGKKEKKSALAKQMNIKSISYFFNFIFISLLLTACAETTKPHYILTDSKLHQYQGGDKLSYGILELSDTSDNAGVLTFTFESTDLTSPSNQTLNALVRNTDTSENISFPFATPNFTQTESHNLILESYTESGNTYWLAEDNNSTTGVEIYPSPISDFVEQRITNAPLINCENTNCVDAGDTSIVLTPMGMETIETDYAKFDAYKFKIEWTATIQNQDLSATLKTYQLRGTQWIYPSLGVVKFNYTIIDEFSNNTLIGSLSATNINIPAENKSKD